MLAFCHSIIQMQTCQPDLVGTGIYCKDQRMMIIIIAKDIKSWLKYSFQFFLAFPSRSLCSTLLSAQVNLLAYFQCLMELLPENQRLEIGGIKYDNQPMPWTTSPKQPYGLCEDFSLLGQIYSLLLIFDFFCGQSELMYQHAANIACYLWTVVWLTPIPQ